MVLSAVKDIVKLFGFAGVIGIYYKYIVYVNICVQVLPSQKYDLIVAPLPDTIMLPDAGLADVVVLGVITRISFIVAHPVTVWVSDIEYPILVPVFSA